MDTQIDSLYKDMEETYKELAANAKSVVSCAEMGLIVWNWMTKLDAISPVSRGER
jgi:hypothetical protein